MAQRRYQLSSKHEFEILNGRFTLEGTAIRERMGHSEDRGLELRFCVSDILEIGILEGLFLVAKDIFEHMNISIGGDRNLRRFERGFRGYSGFGKHSMLLRAPCSF